MSWSEIIFSQFHSINWIQATLVVGVGLVTGFINTLAGSGSLISLPILMFLGLPADVANGTNRVGILFQSIVASTEFKKQKVFEWNEATFLTIPVILGAIPGALIATNIPKEFLNYAIGFLLLFMFFVILYKPEQWIKGKAGQTNARPGILQFIIYFLIGVYGGFIQAGVGFFLLAGLVLGSGFDLLKANAFKVLITAAFTVIALPVFMWYNQVDYTLGFVLAIGSMTGAWLATKLALKKGSQFLRIFLLIIIFGSAIKLLVLDIFFK